MTDTIDSTVRKSISYGSGGEGGIRTHGTVSRTLAFEASTFNRSVTSPRSLVFSSLAKVCAMGYGSQVGDLPQKHQAIQTGLSVFVESGTD
jgi:hypothetical protein